MREQQHRNGPALQGVLLEDILVMETLPALHRDRFDRLLVAQAARGGFHLASNDPEIPRYRVSVLW